MDEVATNASDSNEHSTTHNSNCEVVVVSIQAIYFNTKSTIDANNICSDIVSVSAERTTP